MLPSGRGGGTRRRTQCCLVGVVGGVGARIGEPNVA